jgi:hypothetical protein
MGLQVSIDSTSKFEREPIQNMIQPGVLADVVDKGIVEVTYAGETKKQHKCYIVWLLEELDGEGRNKRVFQNFTLSLHEKATLRKFLGTLGLKEFVPGKPFDLDTLIGTKRMLVLSEEDSTTKPGEKYVRVTGTTALPKGNKGVEIPADFVRAQDRPAK